MRRLRTLVLLVLSLSLLAVTPVSAEDPTPVVFTIAVPAYVHTDGIIDRMVVTGQSEAFDLSRCLDRETAVVGRVVILDKTAGQAGAATGVVIDRPVRAGTQFTNLIWAGVCAVAGFDDYWLYEGTIG